eukprot:scaffold1764_cov139-Isochrysis_galbana.AAC.4
MNWEPQRAGGGDQSNPAAVRLSRRSEGRSWLRRRIPGVGPVQTSWGRVRGRVQSGKRRTYGGQRHRESRTGTKWKAPRDTAKTKREETEAAAGLSESQA